MSHPIFIDTEALQQKLGRPGLVVVDVRGKAAYAFGGHIPGAVQTTWHEFSDPQAAAKGLLDPDVAKLESKIRALGISDDSEVVIYSNPFDNWGDEGRMYWMLEYLGHRNLWILDGGWVKWIDEKRPYEHGVASPKPGTFKAAPNPELIVMKDELKQLVRSRNTDVTIVDARSLEEFAGREMPGIPRPGHVPSAVSVPWNLFLNGDATVKAPGDILALLQEKGITLDRPVICYCTGGVRSSWLYVMLKLAGHQHVRNYPGSWWEWSRDYGAPVEKDAKLLHRVITQEPARPS